MPNRRHLASAGALLAAFLTLPTAAGAVAVAGVYVAGERLAARTSVPVYLPTTIPNGEIGGGVIRATIVSVGHLAYDVGLSQGTCSRPACRFGFIRAEEVRSPATSPTYRAGRCARVCLPSTLSWTQGDAHYVLGLQGGTANALRFMAASMRRF